MLDEEVRVEDVEPFEKEGFMFFQAWTMDGIGVPDRVRLPSGPIVDPFEMRDVVSRRPVFGDIHQKECVRAEVYYSLIRALPLKERNGYLSFASDGDEMRCKRKYRNGKLR